MGRISFLASFNGILFICLFFPIKGLGADYGPKKWFLSGGVSYSVITARKLNALDDSALESLALENIVGFHLRGERGLGLIPSQRLDWTHWIEFAYSLGGSKNIGESGTIYEKDMAYFTLLPLGATYWFKKSAHLDFGASLGLGFAFASKFTTTTSSIPKVYSGSFAPIADLRANSRIWITPYLGAYLDLGLRYFQTTFTAPDLSSASGPGFTWNIWFGATWAIGGVEGTGRTYVEVVEPKATETRKAPPLNPSAPKARSAPAPVHRAPVRGTGFRPRKTR